MKRTKLTTLTGLSWTGRSLAPNQSKNTAVLEIRHLRGELP